MCGCKIQLKQQLCNIDYDENVNRGEEATYFVRFASVFFHKITFPSFYAKFVFHVFSFKNGIFEELHVIVKENGLQIRNAEGIRKSNMHTTLNYTINSSIALGDP